MAKRLIVLLSTFLSLTLIGVGNARADQTIDIDLLNPRIDGTVFVDNEAENSEIPFLAISNANAGTSVSFNITNGQARLVNGILLNSTNADLEFSDNLTFFDFGQISASYLQDIKVAWFDVPDYSIRFTLGDSPWVVNEPEFGTVLANLSEDPERLTGLLAFSMVGSFETGYLVFLFGRTQSESIATSMPLSASAATPAEVNLNGNILTCTPGAYTLGESLVDVSSVIYSLYINETLVSSVSRVNSVDQILGTVLPSSLTSTGVSWNLKSLSNYQARCGITALAYNSIANSTTKTVADAAFVAAANAKAQAWEDQRASATAANFTKEARERRKRAANR